MVLGLLSLWSWRSLVAAGIVNHAPPYAYMDPLGAGGDDGQAILFLKWLPFALAHGMNPIYSKMMFAPQGINLLSNTSVFFPAFVLAPFTVWLGPVAAFDIGVIVAPVVSGYALYWVLRKYGTAVPAALIASLFYAYSPYLMKEVPLGHFHASWMFFPPLTVYLLDEIFVRQKAPFWKSGLALGALTVAQFFTSEEILVDSALLGVFLLVVLAATHPRAAASKARSAVLASAVAVLVAGAVLAYPLWYSLYGPQHVSIFNKSVSTIDNAVTSAVWPSAASVPGFPVSFLGRIDSGFIGPVACGLLFASCLLWRRYRLVPYAMLGALVSYVLTWGPYLRVASSGLTHVKGPDYWLLRVSLLRNLQEYRFADFTDLFVAISIAACLDWSSKWLREHGITKNPYAQVLVGVAAAAAVLAFPLLGGNWHEPSQLVTVPKVFTSGPLTRTALGTVTIVSPPDYVNQGSPLVWQAVSGLRYDDTNGYAWRQVDKSGQGSTFGASSPVSALLGPELFGEIPAPPSRVSAETMRRLRSTLEDWRVGNIVFVRGYLDKRGWDARIFTALLGKAPDRVGGSLVWTGVYERLEAHRLHYRGLELATTASFLRALTSVPSASAPTSPASPPIGRQLAELKSSPAAPGDQLGDSVAISGTSVVVGAPGHADAAGEAYVFTETPGGWKQTAGLTGSDTVAGDNFGSSVAMSGASVVVGAPGHAGDSGRAYVFTETRAGWQQVAELKGSDTAADDTFGSSVAISGTRAVVGAPGHDDDAGESYLFTRTPVGWRQVTGLTGSDRSAGDRFGSSVAISGTTAVVGAFGHAKGGRAYVFSKTRSGWRQAAELKGSDTVAGNYFGVSVDISGTRVLVGAPGHDDDAGKAYLFALKPTGWRQVAELQPGTVAFDNFFGASVAISGTTAVVCASGQANDAGRAYVFARTPAGWRQDAKLKGSDTAADDQFGFSAAIIGTLAVVGAPNHADVVGRAYVFEA